MTTNPFIPAPPASLPAFALSSLSSLAHGGASQTLFIPGENPDHFFALLDAAFELHQPSNEQDSDIVTDSVQARWFLSRRQRSHARAEHNLHSTQEDPASWTPEHLHSLELLDRYKTQAERAFRRALVNVQSIRKDAFAQERWRDQLAFKREQLEFQRQKFEYLQARHAKPTPAQEAAAASEAAREEVRQIVREVNADKEAIQTRQDMGGCAIHQRVYVAVQNNHTFILEVTPSHQKVRELIAHRASYEQVPQAVVRRFTFCDGIIPAEYEWVLAVCYPRPVTDHSHINCYLAFDQWHALAEKEDHLLATQPQYEYSEDELEDDPIPEIGDDGSWLNP